jgi:hypothetical protein
MSELQDALLAGLNAGSTALSTTGQAAVVEQLSHWLEGARKKALPDLPERLNQMRKRFEVLARSARAEFTDNGPVIIATGDAERTLRLLEHGSDWFEPLCRGRLDHPWASS